MLHDLILQHTATHCNTLQHITSHYKEPREPSNMLHDLILQLTATHCNTLQHTATHCNTLQQMSTHCNTQFAAVRPLISHVQSDLIKSISDTLSFNRIYSILLHPNLFTHSSFLHFARDMICSVKFSCEFSVDKGPDKEE